MTDETSADASVELPDEVVRRETPEEIVARETAKSPRRAMCSAILTLESIALALTAPVMIMVAGVSQAWALSIAIGLAVACLVVAGMLRKPWAYHLGTAIQVAAVGLGFVVPMMFFLGGIFALLWGGALFLSAKIAREKGAAWAAWLEEQQQT